MCTFPTSERQKRLKTPAFDTFEFQMCFAPQRRALFRHLNFQKCADGSAPAALASLLFDHPEPQIIGKKHSESGLSYLFAHLHLLSSHSFSSLLFSLLGLSSLTLPTSAFPSVHIVGSLTSKLPSDSFCINTLGCNLKLSVKRNHWDINGECYHVCSGAKLATHWD